MGVRTFEGDPALGLYLGYLMMASTPVERKESCMPSFNKLHE